MKTAYLYIRVSTDEQKRKGYSLPEQEARLLSYCEFHGIEVREIFREDYSAKNFNRPEWNKLLKILRKRKGKALNQQENVLFIKWDRFSRNIEAAYQMIATLRTLNVSPMAIDQPIDFKIPESTVMLAVYLSIPEAENERRSLNVFHGMRRAKRQGRWMGSAPVGYINRSTPEGSKYIQPKSPEADLMRWVFEELAKGIYVSEEVRRMANKKGLKCERNNFWKVIRNPVYCGLIVIPPHEAEEMEIVKGQHEPIISKELFYEVQDVLNGNKRAVATKQVSPEQLPLRGFLQCPKCHRMLTGSASRGKYGGRYYYYHCSCSSCGVRFKAEQVNGLFEEEIASYQLSPVVGELFKLVVMDVFKSSNSVELDERKTIMKMIEIQEAMLSSARRKFVQELIDDEDFKTVKKECNEELRKLELRLEELPKQAHSLREIEKLLDTVVERYADVLSRYTNANDVEGKREMISCMYPEKIVFDGLRHRTLRLSEPLRLIGLINRELKGIKKGKNVDLKHLSLHVARRGIEPYLH